MAKVVLQVNQGRGLSTFGALRLVHSQDGVRKGLFRGLTSSLARQAVYSGVRFGLYDLFCARFVPTDAEAGAAGGSVRAFLSKVGCGLAAGGLGAIAATPIEVVLVRQQVDAKLPPAQRRGYKNVVDGLVRMAREEGVPRMWVGAAPTATRAMIVTASQFVAYDVIKSAIIKAGVLKEGTPAHLVSGFLAGFVASCTSTPVDVVKTRTMQAPRGMYKGMLDCAVKTVAEPGGLLNLYKGFVPTFVRQAPYVVTMFVTLEQMKLLFKRLDGA